MGGKDAEWPPEIIRLAGTLAADGTLEHAYRALLLALPGEADIAREVGANIDPDIILGVREGLARIIAAENAGIFDLYAGLDTQGPFSPDAGSAGRRALRNGRWTIWPCCRAALSSLPGISPGRQT